MLKLLQCRNLLLANQHGSHNIKRMYTVNREGRNISIKTANLAKFSDGACTCSLGDTSVLVTAVSKSQSSQDANNFVPLLVDYRQKAAAAGRIPMTHLRRDIGLTEMEILTSRLIDRSIRPAFPKGYSCDTQIICNLLAVDGNNDADILAINGASTSLAISDIPWNGPVGAVRMGLFGDDLVVNPTRREQENSRFNLVIAANALGNIIMLDGHCKEPVFLNDIRKTVRRGLRECVLVTESIVKLQKEVGKPKRRWEPTNLPSTKHMTSAMQLAQDRLGMILTNHKLDKTSRDEAMQTLRLEYIEGMKKKFPDDEPSTFVGAFNQVVKVTYKKILKETGIRCDGRKFSELRPISCDVNLHKPLHGSALFQRGQTQVFCSTTFDSPDAAIRTDSMTHLLSGIKEKNFMLHYEFPPFATNEIGKVAVMPGRREIGHGALAERAIRPMLPDNQDMTVRLHCDVLESNGSSSMASVCAGSLSLMDAGVGVSEHVAGVAMGLMSDLSEVSPQDTKSTPRDFHILTDILGFEDYIGDMDFKIAGTRKAITAIQLDVKPMYGIPISILYDALQEAHSARSEIINKMNKVIREPRKEKKDNHPVIKTIQIPVHKRAKFLGFGGANLKKLTAQIGVRISSTSSGTVSDQMVDGLSQQPLIDSFTIFAPNKEAMQEAEAFIETLLAGAKEPELEFNGIYSATIQEVKSNGLMVTLYPNMTPTLLHNSQLDTKQINHPSALKFEVGQQIQVKYFGRDPSSGQMRLSRKSLLMSSVPRVHAS